MGKFNKTGKRGMPELNTSSLPDLIFTMLFFFMIVTTMREVTLKVQFKVPQATELEKLEKKSLVSFIYIGKPMPEFQKNSPLCTNTFANSSLGFSVNVLTFVMPSSTSSLLIWM
jgi:biopolymer transport protein ExbD